MITAIDTNILLDILIQDENFYLHSRKLIDEYNAKGQLIICEIVYSELASQFPSQADLKDFLTDTGIKLIISNENSLSLAGDRWKLYVKNRENKIQCTACGKKMSIICSECKNTISFRQHIISDFIIGAHALIYADLILSRDRGYYKTYFQDLFIV